jgi:glutathione peroxidase
MYGKVEVNGEGTHPLYAHLKSAAPGLLGSESLKWNFTKFLVDREGHVVRRYAPTDSPESIEKDIEALL